MTGMPMSVNSTDPPQMESVRGGLMDIDFVRDFERQKRDVAQKISQRELFSLPIKGFHAMCTLVGDFYSLVTANVLNAELLKINNNTVCPDLIGRDRRRVIEVKASERRNYYKLSSRQVDRYGTVRDAGIEVWYAFVIYSAGSKNRPVFKSLAEPTVSCALDFMASAIQYILVLDLSVVNRVIDELITIDTWGTREVQFYRMTTRSVVDWFEQTYDVLDRIGVDLADYDVIRTDVNGLNMMGRDVNRFKVLKVIGKDEIGGELKVEDMPSVVQFAVDKYDAPEEEELPF